MSINLNLCPRWHGKQLLHIQRLANMLKLGHTLIYYPKEGYWIVKSKEPISHSQ